AKLMVKLKLESCQVPQHQYKRGGNAILLPLLADVKGDRPVFRARLRLMVMAASILAALFALSFALLG
ncbi:MAG: hypothetical protein AAGG99_07175, partial [Pseudomonadota bacterium]